MAASRFRDVIAISDVILKYNPNNVDAMLMKGSAYGGLIDTEFRPKYSTPNDIPLELRATYQFYDSENQHAFKRAEALGWHATDGDAPPAKAENK